MKKIILFSLIAINTLVACNKEDNSQSNTNSDNQKQEQKIENQSDNKDKKVSAVLDINKKPVHKLEPVELKLILKEGNEGIKKADITLDLTMPSMTMPKNVVKMKESLGGVYNAQAIFTMSGDWRIYASAKFNGKSQDMYFDVKVE